MIEQGGHGDDEDRRNPDQHRPAHRREKREQNERAGRQKRRARRIEPDGFDHRIAAEIHVKALHEQIERVEQHIGRRPQPVLGQPVVDHRSALGNIDADHIRVAGLHRIAEPKIIVGKIDQNRDARRQAQLEHPHDMAARKADQRLEPVQRQGKQERQVKHRHLPAQKRRPDARPGQDQAPPAHHLVDGQRGEGEPDRLGKKPDAVAADGHEIERGGKGQPQQQPDRHIALNLQPLENLPPQPHR